MSNPSSDSYRNPLRHQGQDYSFSPRYIRNRDPILKDPLNPSLGYVDIKPKEQQGYYPTGSFWTNTSNANLWALQKITNNLAHWILLGTGTSGPLIKFLGGPGTSGFPVSPDVLGQMTLESTDNSISINGITATNTIDFKIPSGPAISIITGDDSQDVIPTSGRINFTGKVVANGTNVLAAVVHPVFFKKLATSTEELDIQLTTTSTNGAKSATKAGLASFDSASFTVDASTGFVQLIGGGSPIEAVTVDEAHAPGTSPVVPNAGTITVTGDQVAAGAVGTHVIKTNSLAANTYTIQIQRSTAVSSSTIADNGVSHFDSAKFLVDSNAFVTTKLGNQVGFTNLGCTLSAGVFTITASDGSALSATNPAYITLPSNVNPGQNITYTVTANQSFQDHNGTSTIAGATFGVTMQTGVAFNSDMPFAIYAVSNTTDNGLNFAICRIPYITFSPLAAAIGKTGSTAAANLQYSFFMLGNPTVANFASTSCLCIGTIRMQSTAAVGTTPPDWTVQTLNQKYDGIGVYSYSGNFVAGCFGAASSSFLNSGAGTLPLFSTQNGTYQFIYGQNNGSVRPVVWFTLGMTNLSRAGVGANALFLYLPFSTLGIQSTGYITTDNAVHQGQSIGYPNPSLPSNQVTLQMSTSVTATGAPFYQGQINNNSLTGAGDGLSLCGTFNILSTNG